MLPLLTSVKPSVISGIFASVAVIMAKLAFDASDSSILNTLVEVHFHTFRYSVALLWVLRAIFGFLAILSNVLMLKYYMASMKINGATKATVFNFSCNFLLTAITGSLLFGEKLSLRWAFAAAVMMVGVIMLARNKANGRQNELAPVRLQVTEETPREVSARGPPTAA